MTEEETYKKELAESGVEIPETKEPKTEVEEPKVEEAPKADPVVEKTEEKAPLSTEPKEERKPRDIYDDYKDKKSALKTEKSLREQAEKERDEFKEKFEAVTSGTKKDGEALDEFEAFAKEIDADPQTLKKMRDLFLKDRVAAETDPEVKKDLEEFKLWKSENHNELEAARYDKEFQTVAPTLKELIPTASEAEMQSVKEHLDVISHKKENLDKDLDYIVFKNKESILKLISPKKRGIETRERKDVTEETFDFDPNADYSKMSMKEKELWEENYNRLSKNDGLAKDAQGRKLFI